MSSGPPFEEPLEEKKNWKEAGSSENLNSYLTRKLPIIGLPPGKTSKRLHFKHPPSNLFFLQKQIQFASKNELN